MNSHPVASAEAALTHQGFRWRAGLAPLCRRCACKERCPTYDPQDADRQCPEALEAEAAIFTEIMGLEHIRPEDAPLAAEHARSIVFLNIIDAWISAVGPFIADARKGTLDVQPVLKSRWSVANAVQRSGDRLGLNPVARAKLKAVTGAVSPLAAAVLALEAGEPDEPAE